MSDGEVEEYEVESITEARVDAQKRSRKNKLQWKYRVRWRGYTAADDTWEPIDSFNGSEQIVETFWSKANTNGRDYSDMSLFKAGEQFLPLGPPRKPRKSAANSSPNAKPPPSNHQRIGSTKRQIEEVEGEAVTHPPSKRPRENVSMAAVCSTLKAGPSQATRMEDVYQHIQATTSFSPLSSNRKSRRPPSPEIIPDSDEEMNPTASLRLNYPNSHSLVNLSAPVSTGNPAEAAKVSLIEGPPAVIDVTEDADSLFDDLEVQQAASRHSRSTQPRVKMVDNPDLMSIEGTLSTKARAVAIAGSSSLTSAMSRPSPIKRRPKPGPGRSSVGLVKQKNTSSLLTAHKGELKTIKGRFVKEDTRRNNKPENKTVADEEDAIENGDSLQKPPPPSAEELLQLAGLDAQQAGDLPDFEDNESIRADIPTPEQEATKATEGLAKADADERKASFHKDRVNDALNQLFPVASPAIDSTTGFGSRMPSTIFGLLGSGSDLAKVNQSKSSEFFLNLDSSISVPVVCHATTHDSQQSINIKVGGKGIPGKFYNPKAAVALLDTLRASGSSAVLTINGGASAQDTEHFQRFVTRLVAGDIFLAMSGAATLVFCAAGNTTLAQRLNASSSLLNQHNTILVCEVDIENYSGYAEATAGSDNRRWTDYTMTVPGDA